MSDPNKTLRLTMFLYVLLLIAGLAVLIVGLVDFTQPGGGNPLLVGVGALCVIVPAALFPIAIRMVGSTATEDSDAPGTSSSDAIQLLRSINDRLLISEASKQITHREENRRALQAAIAEDINKGDYEAAIKLVDTMVSDYGYREDAEQLRREIEQARSTEMNKKIDAMVARMEELVAAQDWDSATREALAIERTFPDSPRVKQLQARVGSALAEYKRDLERQFLDAAAREDVDAAMDLLKQLDKYLSETEAGPFRETARGVITKQRENLGVRFKLAVNDREWLQALRIGEHIIRDFPNTKMAEEVRGMMDQLRERSNAERSARDQTSRA